MTTPKQTPRNQGEGNREAAERYNEAQRRFVDDGKVGRAASETTTLTREERERDRQAEETGRARAREKDPAVVRDHHESTS